MQDLQILHQGILVGYGFENIPAFPGPVNADFRRNIGAQGYLDIIGRRQGRPFRRGQIDNPRIGHWRHDHENDEQNQHDVDIGHHVDFGLELVSPSASQ